MSDSAVQLWMSEDANGPAGKAVAADLALLLERAATGDADAFEQVMLRTERTVMLTSRRLLGNTADAEEAAQEVFLRVYKYLHRFDRGKPFEPWLYRLTINVCNDIRSRRAHSAEMPDLDRQVADTGADPFDALHADDRRRLIHYALDELPQKQRAAVVLRDLQGLSTSEVASILKVSEATVRSHLSSARIRMKKFIERRFRRFL